MEHSHGIKNNKLRYVRHFNIRNRTEDELYMFINYIRNRTEDELYMFINYIRNRTEDELYMFIKVHFTWNGSIKTHVAAATFELWHMIFNNVVFWQV